MDETKKKSSTAEYVLMMGLVLVAVWFFLQEEVLKVMMVLTKYQLEIYKDIPYLIPDNVRRDMALILNELKHDRGPSGGIKGIWLLMQVSGYGLRLIVIPALLLTLLWANRRNLQERFTRKMNLDSLSREAALSNPFIRPIVGKNLHRQDIMEGPFRRPLSGIEFAGLYGLLLYRDEPIAPITKKLLKASIKDKRSLWIDQERARFVTLNKDKTDAFYRNQLGKPFISADSLPIHYKAMLAITAARVAGGDGIEQSEKLHTEIAASYVDHTDRKGRLHCRISYDGVEDALRKYWNHHRVQEIVKRHCWEKTLIMGMLEASRGKGKLPPNQFTWLKIVDRDLFLTINPVGTPYGGSECAFFESQGAWAHFIVEKFLNKGMSSPVIEGATDALHSNLMQEQWIEVKPNRPKSSSDNTLVSKFDIGNTEKLNAFDPTSHSQGLS